MYRTIELTDKVRVPPRYFSMRLEDALTELLIEKYERKVDKDLGIILSIQGVKATSNGAVIPGDPSAYFNVDFEALVFQPEVNEIIKADVTEVVEFGAFLGMGPVDGLVHLSQITNDYLSYNRRLPALVGKETKRTLKKSETVLAKVSTVSMKSSIRDVKIGLTMRPDGLGKPEWIAEDMKKKEKEKSKETVEKPPVKEKTEKREKQQREKGKKK